ncbi:hypothetical protein LTR97_006273 [Elasticomyces elasticus]|uniref:C2H2-type domain-containing protein n=1 Tax=Elasticomyces elasticus TaxID=574655 RepID=A0AAN7WAF9_9PEZI|nr:hypothetical protein LTR97_006273 [Elasticomyces elasticus]
MEWHTFSDTLANERIANTADWLEDAIARDLDSSAAASTYEQLSGLEAEVLTVHGQADTGARVSDCVLEHKSAGTAGNAHDGTVHAHNLDVNNRPSHAQFADGFQTENGWVADHGPDAQLVNNVASHNAAPVLGHITVCYRPSDAPLGSTPESLQCGICMSNKLFNRRFELERHMTTHFPGQYPCMQLGCAFTGARAFRRSDKLVKHKREAHGV